jgi:hypothetical protein
MDAPGPSAVFTILYSVRRNGVVPSSYQIVLVSVCLSVPSLQAVYCTVLHVHVQCIISPRGMELPHGPPRDCLSTREAIIASAPSAAQHESLLLHLENRFRGSSRTLKGIYYSQCA